MKTKQFWYPLPQRLIAQHPSEKRGDDRMMVLHRDTGMLEHRKVSDFPEYITANDLLVVNDTKGFPARLPGPWGDSPGAGGVPGHRAAPSVAWPQESATSADCTPGMSASCSDSSSARA